MQIRFGITANNNNNNNKGSKTVAPKDGKHSTYIYVQSFCCVFNLL